MAVWDNASRFPTSDCDALPFPWRGALWQRRSNRSISSNVPELVRLAEEVQATGEARVLTRATEEIAVLMPVDRVLNDRANDRDQPKSKRFKKELLALAGAWSDLDDEAMIEEVYRARQEAPPSAHVES
jgi:hypothetical protein